MLLILLQLVVVVIIGVITGTIIIMVMIILMGHERSCTLFWNLKFSAATHLSHITLKTTNMFLLKYLHQNIVTIRNSSAAVTSVMTANSDAESPWTPILCKRDTSWILWPQIQKCDIIREAKVPGSMPWLPNPIPLTKDWITMGDRILSKAIRSV